MTEDGAVERLLGGVFFTPLGLLPHMEKHPDFANLVRAILAASVGRQNDREAIANLLPPSLLSPATQPAAPPSPDSAFGAR
jgi:hypothetical protein